MAEDAITIENLSKSYLIGHRNASSGSFKYKALRDVINQEVRNFARKASDVFRGRQIVQGDEIEEFHALTDVSFSVKQGEVLGVVGRNGAGKSTLLKILSRITEPTKGRIVLNGRVASLLEVGTGFHPELTGRENIFLNGAVLGMAHNEIRRKFDEIVAFAEVEKFLDTPVKHYSSGMYVRLAFAVAAHLEPEILIVDEVLAVGDAEFQKKCLGKMDEVSRSGGRTVLFVSHNMETVLKLCTRGVLFEQGRVRQIGDTRSIVSAYMSSRPSMPTVVDLSKVTPSAEFAKKARLLSVKPSPSMNDWSVPYGKDFSVELSIEAAPATAKIDMALDFKTRGFEVATWMNRCSHTELSVRPGINTFRVTFEGLRLLPGQYFLGINLGAGRGFESYMPEAIPFEIVTSPEAAEIGAEHLGGAVMAMATAQRID
ncbi:MAG: ABC transporter ATP-binding protein [Bradyrhizobium sp.]|uniref:ABC transporter ATP-binding protein n=1 Tax=Bradyrhizobium sp. TaxID=376 RepID=UPI0029BD481E|nr:ABC transporter ATP-binding protein [Bradyrhizobium sp.]MDX3969792.1 ABC transporter ATP-binding protein [Bradyrhizobium sp.]